MFKIGDFSKLCRVSVRMLRHYDEMGLLKPERVDNFTGYRYYSAHQLSRLNRILALRDLGLSLDQVAQILKEGLTSDQIRGMLKLKKAELRQQITDGLQRLERIETWLEREELMISNYNVVVKKVEPVLVAETRGVAPDMEQIPPTLNTLFDRVADYLVEQGYATAPLTSADSFLPAIAIYYDMEMNHQNIQIGACLPLTRPLPSGKQVEVKELPAVETVASVIHNGSFNGLGEAYKALMEWIEANQYQICGPNRELNLAYKRNGDPSKYVTEIQFPVSKA
jgi:DNA-binding transcriptional MerR regulator/effector-binding domain-containing protein